MSGINRKGFAMILAIFIIVMIAAGGTILLKNASVGSKSIGDNYLHAQAELLGQSATEFALMRAQGVNTAAGTCLNQLNITVYNANGTAAGDKMFDINVSLAYTFRGAAPAACTTLASNTGKDTMVLIDTMVTDHNIGTEEVRVQKRSWQKL
ncbi:hypothetical protein [Sulfuricurvum sp.]|uniref:hypothetical protein n=1 Tax=Sulfuricurvum sp. TaxID=2025608 RepID=UPI003BB165C1